MTEDGRAIDADLREGSMDQLGLGFICPDRAAWTLAVAESRAVEHDDPVRLSRHIDQAAGLEILDHAAIAMEQDQWFAFATDNVVEANPIHLDELPGRRTVALSLSGKPVVDEGRDGEPNHTSGCADCVGVRPDVRPGERLRCCRAVKFRQSRA
jgi:hypothetical protein